MEISLFCRYLTGSVRVSVCKLHTLSLQNNLLQACFAWKHFLLDLILFFNVKMFLLGLYGFSRQWLCWSCWSAPSICSLYLQCNSTPVWTKDYVSQPLLELAVACGMQVGVTCAWFTDHALKRKLCLNQEVDAMVSYLELWVLEHNRDREETEPKEPGSLTPWSCYMSYSCPYCYLGRNKILPLRATSILDCRQISQTCILIQSLDLLISFTNLFVPYCFFGTLPFWFIFFLAENIP